MRSVVIALHIFALLLPTLVIPLAEGADFVSGHTHADSMWHVPEPIHVQADLDKGLIPENDSSQEHSNHSHMVFFTVAVGADLNTQRAFLSFDIPEGSPPLDQQWSPPRRPPKFI